MSAAPVAFAVKWACPKCGADADKCGRGFCESRSGKCNGFLCECEEESPTHGESLETPCLNAVCAHCGWSGKFPRPPKGLASWEKKALEAGWLMPAMRAQELATAKPPTEPTS